MPKFKCIANGISVVTNGKGRMVVSLDNQIVFNGEVSYKDPAAVMTYTSMDGNNWILSVNPLPNNQYEGFLSASASVLPGGRKILRCNPQ